VQIGVTDPHRKCPVGVVTEANTNMSILYLTASCLGNKLRELQAMNILKTSEELKLHIVLVVLVRHGVLDV
jgi:hypothetical protein